MSLGIAFKGPEGIVLAADSRVTLQAQIEGQPTLQVHYDNATKLLRVAGQDFIGVVTYGAGAIGNPPRTAHSFLPEFEAELAAGETGRLPVNEFANRLSAFFMQRWQEQVPQDYQGQPMVFLVGGYDEDAAYGRVFEVAIPTQPSPREHQAGPGEFGMVYGGQQGFVERLLNGFDGNLLAIVKEQLKPDEQQQEALRLSLQTKCSAPIPFAFLPLQDCVDLAIFCIRATVAMQTWFVGVRGVGGAIDVATITRTAGITHIQQKAIVGERF